MSKPNIAAAIALGRTAVRRASVSVEEDEAAVSVPVENVAIADSKAETAPAVAANTRDGWEATRLGAISNKKKPGPQRRTGTFLKRIFTLDRDTSDYVNQAWRSYRTRDGHLVDSMSEFVAAVLAEHRDKRSH